MACSRKRAREKHAHTANAQSRTTASRAALRNFAGSAKQNRQEYVLGRAPARWHRAMPSKQRAAARAARQRENANRRVRVAVRGADASKSRRNCAQRCKNRHILRILLADKFGAHKPTRRAKNALNSLENGRPKNFQGAVAPPVFQCLFRCTPCILTPL